MTEGVKLFLRNLNLEQYHEMFVAKGFDLESDICHLNDADLDSMYITEDRHRQQILEAGWLVLFSYRSVESCMHWYTFKNLAVNRSTEV